MSTLKRTRKLLEQPPDLYLEQPKPSTSKLTNVNNEGENVLGYFWVSTLSTKRINILYSPVKELPIDWFDIPTVKPLDELNQARHYYELPLYGNLDVTETYLIDTSIYYIWLETYPYLVVDSFIYNRIDTELLEPVIDSVLITTNNDCYDCRKHGGIDQLPDFWKE